MNATALPAFLSSLLESRRVDPDFNPSEADIEMVAKLLARAATTPITYHEGNGNGKFQKWMLGVMALLAVSAVGGGIAMYGELSALRVEVSNVKDEVREIRHELAPRTKP